MEPPDLDELFDSDCDPDLLAKNVWEKVPAPIRKIVQQHVAARLPAKILAKLRDLTPADLQSVMTMRFSISAAAWPSEPPLPTTAR